MIKSHQHLDLSDTPIIEKVVLQAPFTFSNNFSLDACFMCALDGTSEIFGPQGSLSMKSQEAVVMKCGNFVQRFIEGKKSGENEVLVIHFYPEVLKSIFDGEFPEILKEASSTNRVLMRKLDMDSILKSYIDSILFYFDNPSIVNDELIRLKLKELILLLSKTEQSEDIREMLADMFNPEEKSFKHTIQSNLYERLNTEELALLTAMSVSSFKRKFKEVFGDAPGRYIKTKKLEKAANLLIHTDMRISELCYECGFNDLAHFSKSFVQQYGCSPSEYRNTQA